MEHTEYPFGFGFALMQNPKALERFRTMSDLRKREWMRKLPRIQTEEDLREFVEAIAVDGASEDL